MAQMTERSKPQHYNIVGSQSGAILATVSYSKAQQVMATLQKNSKEKLKLVLIIVD